MEKHSPNFLEPPLDVIEEEEEYEVEQVLDSRHFGRKKQLQYLLKWKGYFEVHNSWEPANQVHVSKLVKKYHKQKLTAVKAIKRLVIESSVNMSQSTSPLMLGYTWDQLHSATVDLDKLPKRGNFGSGSVPL
jgi:Chromo (CHRromatin Organisation MOdifier) domain